MIYLALSILVSSLLFVIFKLFDVFKINTLQAIVVNYAIALLYGLFTSNTSVSIVEIPQQNWFFGAFCLGFLFISIFNVMGITAQRNGLSVASVSGKMSVVIPVIFGIIVYNEDVGFVKIVGIVIALFAVYLSSAKSDTTPVKFKNLLFPLLLFIGSGVLDTGLKYVETTSVLKGEEPLFLATIFGCAFVLGLLVVLFQIIKGKFKFHWKNILGGILLGVPNYYSMELLLKAFKTDIDSSTLFTINNVGIVVLTTVFALLFFKEKLIKKNWVGFALAIISILLVSFA
ncbi:EamA-like transporter family protein [Lutibacter sp. Hel_I_33_5]|uniref:EamA family transporter n=1 Tax=Lutibacter sp. Hel_I_33_5 TaxID=1566289 RepID=UPI0011A6EB8A|nr:EamA family transporter [Lutibacter sp. Hel_I_33_5]TVZ55199.1 EamA-like transporter family protein [Lutibacter sp. Hel_I_33_5]